MEKKKQRMEINKEYKQIYLNDDNAEEFDGKTIKYVSMVTDKDTIDQNEIIIVFTDKTFCVIGIDENYDDVNRLSEITLCNTQLDHPLYHNNGELTHTVHNGKLRFEPYIKKRIESGLWIVTEQDVEKLKAKHKRDRDVYDYKQYLRLKKQFEGREDEFKGIKI